MPRPGADEPAATPLVSVEGWLIDLPLREALRSSHGVAGHRTIGIVAVTDADGRRGWGEISSMPTVGYTAEWAEGSFDRSLELLAPALLADGGLPDDPAWPFARAGLDLALVDLEARRRGRSLAADLAGRPGPAARVRAGAVVGRFPTVDELVARVAELTAEGYRRVKAKIEPGWTSEPLQALRSTFPELVIQADANGAFGPDDVDALARLGSLGLVGLEQPFAVDDAESHRRLHATATVPVLLDESAERWDPVGPWAGTAQGLVIKPGRVGGWHRAAERARLAREAGLHVAPGGMLESGLGRRALAAFAALPEVDLTGDCSPAARWYDVDPWPGEELADDGTLAVWIGPGVAPPPDPGVLARLTREQYRLDA